MTPSISPSELGFRGNRAPIILQSLVILFLIVVKTIFSPLLLEIESEFGVSHVGGASSFFFLSTGTATLLLALPVRGMVVVGVFLQPVILCCFFPAGFAAVM